MGLSIARSWLPGSRNAAVANSRRGAAIEPDHVSRRERKHDGELGCLASSVAARHELEAKDGAIGVGWRGTGIWPEDGRVVGDDGRRVFLLLCVVVAAAR